MNIFFLVTVILFGVWSYIDPAERGTWWLEAAPVVIALPLLAATAKRFPLTPMLYALIWLHMLVLLLGAHYTYAHVPLGEWAREAFAFDRNHYDRFGHFMQGFVPAMIGRELLLRTSPLKSGKWLFALLVLSCLGISALYEIVEWIAAAIGKQGAESFLGTQGDVWDTQKDMAIAALGAAAALLILGKRHDAQLLRLSSAANR